MGNLFPRRTAPLKLETFPTRIFLSEIPKGTTIGEIQSLFKVGKIGEIHFRLQGPENGGDWLGFSTVIFKSHTDGDSAMASLSRLHSVSVGPLTEWVRRRDIQ